MKVLHVIPSVSERSGGPGHAIISMCRSLQNQGAEVLIATTDHGIPTGSESTDKPRKPKPESQDSYKGIPTIFFPSQWGNSFKYSRPLADWLDLHVKDFDIVHIHAVFNHASVAAARACREQGVPYVVRPLGTLDPWSMKQKAFRKSLFWWAVGKRMLGGAAAVHYTAAAEKEAAEDSLGLIHGKVIPLGVDLQVPTSDCESFAGDHSHLEQHPYVLVLSRLHPKKGLDVLVEAFLSLVQAGEFSAWRLVLAGEGPDEYVRALKQMVSAHNAENLVSFPGWLENEKKNVFLRHASLLALPSHHENFGLCVMEALAFGVPVLVSPQVNLSSEIEAVKAGWIAPVETKAIRAALAGALGSEDERKKRGEAGRQLSRKFSNENVALQLNEMYRAVSASAV